MLNQRVMDIFYVARGRPAINASGWNNLNEK